MLVVVALLEGAVLLFNPRIRSCCSKIAATSTQEGLRLGSSSQHRSIKLARSGGMWMSGWPFVSFKSGRIPCTINHSVCSTSFISGKGASPDSSSHNIIPKL